MLIIATGYVKQEFAERDFPGMIYIWMPACDQPQEKQSKFGENLLMQAASSEIVVFTQSEDVLNGARIGKAKHPDVEMKGVVYYEDGRRREVTFGGDGIALPWPKGFFDQNLNDLCELMGLRRKKHEEAKQG